MATAFVLFASCTVLLPTTRAFTSPSSQQLVVSRQRFCSATTTTAAMMQQSPSSGPRQALIEKRLNQAFNPTFLKVQNTSHGQRSDESHFKVVVVSESFEGTRSLVGRHRAIHKALSESNEDGSSSSLGFHSLEIGAAKTPEEWGENSVVASSPKCQGGERHEKLVDDDRNNDLSSLFCSSQQQESHKSIIIFTGYLSTSTAIEDDWKKKYIKTSLIYYEE